MKLHDGPVIEVPVPHRNLKRLSSQSMGGSMDGEPSTKQVSLSVQNHISLGSSILHACLG